MKYIKYLVAVIVVISTVTGCQSSTVNVYSDAVNIVLSDHEIMVGDIICDSDTSKDVYRANDIVYYEDGKDFTYGEGEKGDEHSSDEALKHTVVHITKPGTYSITGKLSYGQIAVDLGKDAKEDTSAVVTLILNGVDITCDVAPAVIFYNVYECGNTDEDKASKDVDTSKAGANVIIADNSVNNINGSYVAKIYKSDSVVLNSDKTEVEDAKKLHKYDGAFYSKMSMNVNGESKNTGVLNINAKNEGLDSELHLTINGGNINIKSGNDGINTNEDNISVTTINNGALKITVSGETGEGDGIDSNGWLVINGGTVIAEACATSGDAGIDSDKGIHINGGTVIASGHMLDRIENGGQNYAVFTFKEKLASDSNLLLKDKSNKTIMDHTVSNQCSIVVYSSSTLKEGEYTLWNKDKQLSHQGGQMNMGPGGMGKPDGTMKPDGNMTIPDGQVPPKGGEFKPDGTGDFDPNKNRPNNNQQTRPQKPDGDFTPQNPMNNQGTDSNTQEASNVFKMVKGGNMFNGIS